MSECKHVTFFPLWSPKTYILQHVQADCRNKQNKFV